MRCVVLIGFMGAGKTTVGRELARRLRWHFLDLDDVIEQREQKSVAEIFASSGEAAFRQAESAALAALLQDRESSSDLVLALGGGAFVRSRRTAQRLELPARLPFCWKRLWKNCVGAAMAN